MTDTLEIFCDESGYTGPDLLHDRQPHFAYAGVRVSAEEARGITYQLRRDHLIANPELKATELLQTAAGRGALLDLLRTLDGRFAFVTYHKVLGLCGKLFEYVYEPVFQDAPAVLYERNLHRFTAMFGLMLRQGGDPFTAEALRQFQQFMRSRDTSEAPILFSDEALDEDSPYSAVATFARGYRDRIVADRHAAERTGDPALDLGASGLWSLLTRFGGEGRPLSVTCDNSPLTKAAASKLSGGPGDIGIRRVRSLIANPEVAEFQLARPIDFADSKTSEGLQLADLVAGVATATLDGRLPKEMFEQVSSMLDAACLHSHSVLPEESWIDLTAREPTVNWLILMELAARAADGQDPRHGLRSTYRDFDRAWSSGELSAMMAR